MNKSRMLLWYVVAGLILIIAQFAYINYVHQNQKKIAYVRSADLVNKYRGMQEARSLFEEKSHVWEANIDTLRTNYRAQLEQYNKEMDRLSENERKDRETYLFNRKNELLRYSESLNSKAKEEEEKMLEGVLNQVNAFVEKYAMEQGYDLILGTTLSGSILYGEKMMDITDEVLEELNEDYKGSVD